MMIIAVLFAAYSVISAALDRALVTAPMIFVAAGIVRGPKGFNAVGLELTHGTGLVVAELALAIALFAAAARAIESLPASSPEMGAASREG